MGTKVPVHDILSHELGLTLIQPGLGLNGKLRRRTVESYVGYLNTVALSTFDSVCTLLITQSSLPNTYSSKRST